MYLYSKWSDKGLLYQSGTNRVADIYEMIGIYQDFCADENVSDFAAYYQKNVGLQPYHYRNIGERLIKCKLLADGKDIPRRNFRLLSQTYKRLPVMASSDMGEIFFEIIEYIYGNQDILACFQSKFTPPCLPPDILKFQYDFLNKYVNTIGFLKSIQKKKVFKRVLEDWKENRIFKQL